MDLPDHRRPCVLESMLARSLQERSVEVIEAHCMFCRNQVIVRRTCHSGTAGLELPSNYEYTSSLSISAGEDGKRVMNEFIQSMTRDRELVLFYVLVSYCAMLCRLVATSRATSYISLNDRTSPLEFSHLTKSLVRCPSAPSWERSSATQILYRLALPA